MPRLWRGAGRWQVLRASRCTKGLRDLPRVVGQLSCGTGQDGTGAGLGTEQELPAWVGREECPRLRVGPEAWPEARVMGVVCQG